MLMCFSNDASMNLGGRFSKSSTERERILQLRKEQLLLSARRRYMERHKSEVAQRDITSDREAARVRHRHADS
jgi:autocrine motility factor receptor